MPCEIGTLHVDFFFICFNYDARRYHDYQILLHADFDDAMTVTMRKNIMMKLNDLRVQNCLVQEKCLYIFK